MKSLLTKIKKRYKGHGWQLLLILVITASIWTNSFLDDSRDQLREKLYRSTHQEICVSELLHQYKANWTSKCNILDQKELCDLPDPEGNNLRMYYLDRIEECLE